MDKEYHKLKLKTYPQLVVSTSVLRKIVSMTLFPLYFACIFQYSILIGISGPRNKNDRQTPEHHIVLRSWVLDSDVVRFDTLTPKPKSLP